MHALGRRDVVTDAVADPQEAWAVCHHVNLRSLQDDGSAYNDNDPVGGPLGSAFRVRAERCAHHPPGSPFHNPYGMWRIVRTEAFPTMS